jgi:Cu+-exporting ATPase
MAVCPARQKNECPYEHHPAGQKHLLLQLFLTFIDAMNNQKQQITLLIEGMDCSNCAMGISKSLEKKGMQNVSVNFATGEANFSVPESSLLKPAIDAIHSLGYKVVDQKYLDDMEGKWSPVEKKFFFTLPFTIILFFSHMLLPHDFILNHPYVQLLLCIPVFITGMLQFGRSAFSSIRAGVPNMDVLIFIGSTAAFIYSVAGIILFGSGPESHRYMFFETSATIITLVLLGNVLEHRSVKQTTSAIRELSKLQASTAKVLSLHLGKEIITEMPLNEVHPGAILQVNTGDSIPVDGSIYSGEASIDESMLSGESVPLEKSSGQQVYAGTVVQKGSFRMRAEALGKDTMLSRIIALVKKAQQEKPQIQRLGDKISAIFVPVVLGISLLTFVISAFVADKTIQDSLLSSIAVLVISCPCAMGLATPTAVMSGIGRAAKKGILIKGGQTLETFAAATTIIFDKTGTLTTGKFRLSGLRLYSTINEEEVKGILYSLEKHSSHPIAKSIVADPQFSAGAFTLSNVKEEKGLGMSGEDKEGNSYKAGSANILSGSPEHGHSIYLTKNGVLIAGIDLRDETRAGTLSALKKLRAQGIRTILLSGDRKEKCLEIARELNISEVYSEQKPEEKLNIVSALSTKEKVAMIGDGINDAPALAQASVGISLGKATQSAIESSQVILMKEDLESLAEAYLISKHTLITIKQNLFWAFAYNIVAIPVAALGLLNPMAGALFMAFSDVIVIGNSIRLKTKKLR